MRWNRFFEDLEHQLDSEQAAEQLALDGEAERLRLSRLELRTRLSTLVGCELGAELAGEGSGGEPALLRGTVAGVGADWLGLVLGRGGAAVAPLRSIRMLRLDRPSLVASRGVPVGGEGELATTQGRDPGGRLRERQTFGFVLRDFARRRLAVALHLGGERVVRGTIDRVGADHLGLALHEPGAPRREGEVSGFRLVPLHAVAWVQLDRPEALLG